MITFALGVDDLADTRFAISPLHETVISLRVLRDPGLSAIHLPWRRSAVERIGTLDTALLMSLVAQRFTIADFLTPRPAGFAPDFAAELAVVRGTPAERVRRELIGAHLPDSVPDALRAVHSRDDGEVTALLESICDLLRRFWELTIAPLWPAMRSLLEADMTYRARQLALGGARRLFADMHPNLVWHEGILEVHNVIDDFRITSSGRGMLLVPSVFTHKPTPPASSGTAPGLGYPCRGVATLWAKTPPADTAQLRRLLGETRTRLLLMLEDPLSTTEIARRMRVTPSAASQHLRVLHATGLLSRARHGRQVLYRRSTLADQLTGQRAQPSLLFQIALAIRRNWRSRRCTNGEKFGLASEILSCSPFPAYGLPRGMSVRPMGFAPN